MSFAQPFLLTAGTPSVGKRNWYQNPGQDGSFWVQPFYSSANWITSGALVVKLRNGNFAQPHGVINMAGNFSAPFYIGQATDPLVQVTDGTKTINVHIPLGSAAETPTSGVDMSIGGTDASQPYLVWSISDATINTGTVAASGSVITGTYGMCVQDGAGLIMVDAVTGTPGSNNSIGGLMDYELSQGNADPNYVIQHMLTFQMDPTQAAPGNAGTLAWPLNAGDGGATYTGIIPQGITIGIPASTPRPTGQTRGFYLLFDNLQQYGWFNYNFGGAGCTFITAYVVNPANQALANDCANSISAVMNYVCILNYANNVAGAQYSLATTKGFTTGATSAFTPPPPLDLTPTGGVNVAPSSFGAWYPNTGYTATPTNT